MKQEPEEPRPSHHHRRITEAAPPPTNNHSIHHKFIHDHCCSSVSSNCVFFCPHPNNHRIHFWAEGRRVKGTAAALCPRRDTPPGRRVGFFARVLSFLLCKKNASQVFPSYRATSSVIPQRFGGFHIWGRRGQDQPRPPLHPPSTAPRRIKCVTDERERVFNI